jgi:hypothetical protein
MDSSRGGPLSNLILLLPLIVVPAVAILRPADQDSGFVGDDLTASEDGFMSGTEDFDANFFRDLDAESASVDGEKDRSSAGDVAIAQSDFTESHMSSSDRSRPKPETTHQHPETHSNRQENQGQRLPDLSHLGVTSSMWFSPGANAGFGFVAFVPTEKDSVRYRFSSIQKTEEAAVDDVAKQIRVWRQARRNSSSRKTP